MIAAAAAAYRPFWTGTPAMSAYPRFLGTVIAVTAIPATMSARSHPRSYDGSQLAIGNRPCGGPVTECRVALLTPSRPRDREDGSPSEPARTGSFHVVPLVLLRSAPARPPTDRSGGDGSDER